MPAPYRLDPKLMTLHDGMWVADLHSDSLLWNRDLNEHGTYGHVDVPRLLEGKVDFFVASTVSKTPWGLNMEANDDDSDMLVANSMIQGWPPRTWSSLLQRVLYQGEKLHRFAEESAGKLEIVTTASALRELHAKPGRQVVGSLLATEGGHVLEGKIENLATIYDAGFRMMGLIHFFDNELGGSAHGLKKGGLTAFGKKVVAEMESRKMLVDLAHASRQTIIDTLAVATRPVVISHTGIAGTCPGPRNLTDEQLLALKANGAIIGIAVFAPAICELSYKEAARTFRYAADLVGVEHIALGSDFDGATETPTDVSGLALLTEALLQEGFSEDEVSAIMGGNILRFFSQHLPG